MKGIYHIKVHNKKMTYEFDLRRNITVINGDSGTGKSTLCKLIADASAGIAILESKTKCMVLTDEDWFIRLYANKQCVVFIDEEVSFIRSDEFSRAVQETDNYFVIISRTPICTLPYSVEEIYEIKTSGKYHSLVRKYPITIEKANPDVLLVEDSKSGYMFYSNFCADKSCCITARGNGNILNILFTLTNNEKEVLLIADGAAFGGYIESICRSRHRLENTVRLFLPESFEYLLLCSDLFAKDKKVQAILANPFDYVDSSDMSWERFFTKLLIEVSKGTPFQYNKNSINCCYIQNCCCKGNPCKLKNKGDKFDLVMHSFYNMIDFSKIRKRKEISNMRLL